jgi:hypothetical protein
MVYAPTGGGFYLSKDGGGAWTKSYHCYCRATWIDPNDPEHIILGPADGVDRNGRVEESLDGGQSWRMVSDGLDVPWSRHMVERFHQVDRELIALLSNGEVIAASLDRLMWRRILPELSNISAVTSHVTDPNR